MRLVRYRGYWAVTGIDGNGKQWRRSLRTRDRAAAERAFADYRKPVQGETIGEIMEAYLADKRGRRSHGSMETAWRSLQAVFGHLRADHVSRTLCRQYAISRRGGGVADGTIIKDLGVLKAALRWAKKDQGAVFELPPTPPPRDRYITRAEVQRLVDAAELGHVKLFITLAWCTAGRHSALLELTWDRVDLDAKTVRLATGAAHGSKGRATVRVAEWGLAALRASYEARTTNYVIEWGGKPLKSIKRSFGEAARRAGLEDVTPHVLRHSSAVAMVGAGVSMAKVSQFLGHTSTKVTEKVYGRFQPDHMEDAARALE
jgi:integrase